MTQTAKNYDPLGTGQAACAGCTMKEIVATIIKAAPIPKHIVEVGASGCSIVAQQIFPFSAWDGINSTHIIFETTGGVLTGFQKAMAVKKRRGLLPEGAEPRALGMAGDGATADIGSGSLSGWLDRGDTHGVYLCYDNGGYQNTGTQRSSTTPEGAHTTTSPHGYLPSEHPGGKDMLKFVASHPAVAYAAHTTICTRWPHDLAQKAKAAFAACEEGPVYLHVISPCPRGWAYPPELAQIVGDIGIETGAIPLYHFRKKGFEQLWYVDYVPERYEEFFAGGEIRKDVHPIEEWLKSQLRFKDVLADPAKIASFQARVDHKWKELKKICEPYGSE